MEQVHLPNKSYYQAGCLPLAKPSAKPSFAAILFALLLSVVNILMPRIIQTFMDNYLTPKTATQSVIFFFAALYFFGVLVKKPTVFPVGFYIPWLL